MGNDVTVSIFFLLLVLCVGALHGLKKRCCHFEHEECQVFQKNGESICEKTITRLEVSDETVFLPVGSSNVTLLPDAVSFYTDQCNAVQCEPSIDYVDSWETYPGGCEDKYCEQYVSGGEPFLFMRIPFVLRGENVTQIEFHISWPNNDKGDHATRIVVNTSRPVAGDGSSEDKFVLSGVGMLNTNENDVSLLMVQPGANVVVSAYSPGSNDTIIVNVPDCHQLTIMTLANNHHCKITSAATFEPEVVVSYVAGKDQVPVRFRVMPEEAVTPGYNVTLLRLPTYEVIDAHAVKYDHDLALGDQTDGWFYMRCNFTNVADGTYVVTVTMQLNKEDYAWEYWGYRGKLAKSDNFTVFKEMEPTTDSVTTPDPTTNLQPTSKSPHTSSLTTLGQRTNSPTISDGFLTVGVGLIILIICAVLTTCALIALFLRCSGYRVSSICELLKKRSGTISLSPVTPNASIIGYEPRPLDTRPFHDIARAFTVHSGTLSIGETTVADDLLEGFYQRELSSPGTEEYSPMIPSPQLQRPVRAPSRLVQSVHHDMFPRDEVKNNTSPRVELQDYPDRGI